MSVTRSVIWRRIDAPGAEYCALREDSGKAWLDGTVITELDGEPAMVHYTVTCLQSWQTASLELSLYQAGSRRSLTLRRNNGGWVMDAQQQGDTQLAGCIDVDLSVTPSTNTLPIRRLNLAVGESADVTAAWVRFPSLAVQPLRQRYTRLAPDRYLYESLESDFTAELSVDDLGLVTHYPGGWERWTPERPFP